MTVKTKKKNVKFYKVGYTGLLLGVAIAATWFTYKFLEERY